MVVDGPSGSGKTRLAAALAAALRAGGEKVSTLSTDLLATWREPFSFWSQLEEQVLGPLARGEQGRLQVVDWTGPEPRPGGWRRVPVPDLLILEGVSAGRRAVRDRAGLLVWVELPDRALRLERAVGRDGEHTRSSFRAWQDAEDVHFAAEGTRAAADLHVPARLDRPVIGP
ncbi:uridine kinase [Nakamurella flavida]|uniref:Uridine kinase n=2 Tax=Nakamurella flavida TaxID=363630 RepID=A0A939C510_9ACTN|nr:uridine kinase [Nakamurella flavida]MBM9476309.1 uridine kinase [Nakamurella flavida]